MKFYKLMLGACALGTFSIASSVAAQDAASAAAPTQAAAKGILPAGTAVNFSMDKALATDKRDLAKGEAKPDKEHRRVSNVGDLFTMTVRDDVKLGDTVVIPKGSIGTGEVTMVTGRGSFGKSGKIEIKVNNVKVGDKTYLMEGTFLQKGKGRGGAAIAGTIIAGAIAGAFIKGDDADIPVNAEMMFRTKEAIEI